MQFRNYLPLEKNVALHLNKLDFPLPKYYLCQFWLTLAEWSWRRFLKFVNVFLLCCKYLPLKKGRALDLNKLESPSPKDELYQVWLKLDHWFWRRNYFSMYFCKFVIISPWKGQGPSFEQTWIPFTQEWFTCMPSLVEIGEEDFFKFVNVFLQFCNHLPFEKSGAFYLHKLESP